MRFEEQLLKPVEKMLRARNIDAKTLLEDLAAKRAVSTCSVLEDDDTADVQDAAFSELLEQHDLEDQEEMLGKLWADAKLAISAFAEEVGR